MNETIILHNVNPYLLDHQRRTLEALLSTTILPKTTIYTLTGLLNMLDNWSDMRYFDQIDNPVDKRKNARQRAREAAWNYGKGWGGVSEV